MLRKKGGSAWQARIEGLVECSFFTGQAFTVVMANSLFVVESPSRFSCPESAVGPPWLAILDSHLQVPLVPKSVWAYVHERRHHPRCWRHILKGRDA
jgi:hypothetical protein